MMNWYGDMTRWIAAWMWIPPLLIVIVLVVLAVASMRAFSPAGPSDTGLDAPVAIAARRLAKGEISTEDYEKIRVALGEK